MAKEQKSRQVAALGEQFIDFSDVEFLPPDIRRLISDPATFGDPSVLGYTASHSAIAQILHENPASDRMLRIVYPDTNGQPLTEGLDQFLSRSLSGQALRDRLDFCSRWLSVHFVQPGKHLIDLGGGSGSYAFKALQIKKPPDGFVWRVVDLDAEAIYYCRRQATAEKLGGIVQAVLGNLMSSNSVGLPFDYAVLIGVLCGMDHDTAVNCLKRIRVHLKPCGELLAATLLTRAFKEDPKTFRVLCNVGGWQLRPKTLEEVKEIFRSADWQILEIASERPGNNGQYAIVHAKT